MYRFNYRIILILVLIFSLNTVSFPQDNNLKERFESNKSNVINILTNHSLSHKNCILSTIAPKDIENIIFVVTKLDNRIRGYPAFAPQYIRLFVNSDRRWTDSQIKLFIIHEMLHKNVCGDDRVNTKPACFLFGVQRYRSEDIDNAIVSHLDLN